MLHVRIPIDLGTVSATECSAFALMTPLRVREILALAVAHTLGKHSPSDRRERVLETTLAGLADDVYVLEIDGQRYTDPDRTIACEGTIALRFFTRAVTGDVRPREIPSSQSSIEDHYRNERKYRNRRRR